MVEAKESIQTRPTRKAGKGLHIGYVRVSAVDQNELRQLDGLELDKTFTDKASGKDVNRPQLELLLSFIRRGRQPSLPFDGPARAATWTIFASWSLI